MKEKLRKILVEHEYHWAYQDTILDEILSLFGVIDSCDCMTDENCVDDINDYVDKIKLEKIDPMGNVIETIELDGRWKITTDEKSYFMTNRYVDEIKVDLEKIQKNFMDNL